jgi:hypothetical protein
VLRCMDTIWTQGDRKNPKPNETDPKEKT